MIVGILYLLCVDGYLMILVHVVGLKFAFDLKLNSLYDWVAIIFLDLFIFAYGNQVGVKLLKLILDLVLNIVEVKGTLARRILSDLQGNLLGAELDHYLNQRYAAGVSLVIAVGLDSHEEIVQI